MSLSNYDLWKTSVPENFSCVVDECIECGSEIREGDQAVYDREGYVHYCSEECFKKYFEKNPSEFIDFVKEQITEQVRIGEGDD